MNKEQEKALEAEIARLLEARHEVIVKLGERDYALRNKTEEAALVLSRAEGLERELEAMRMSRDHFKSLVQNAEAGEKKAVMKCNELEMRCWDLLELFEKTFSCRVRKFWREKVECFQLMIKKPRFSWHNKE
jgi:hypothetical protein